MDAFSVTRIVLAGALLAAAGVARAQDKLPPPPPQDAPAIERPVTPPNSYRVVMENDRVRMIEVHVKPHSKVDVESPPNRERFLYMLSDGALILAQPGKAPYEFAMHAGETAVFPPVSPTVENDTDSPVRALMVEIKEPMRSAAAGKVRGKRGKVIKVTGVGNKVRVRTVVRSSSRPKQTAVSRKPAPRVSKPAARIAKPAARVSKPAAAEAKSTARAPLNLSRANAKPAKKVTGRTRGSNG